MTTNANKTPTWLIERLAQGELDTKAAAEVHARLRAEGRDVDEVLAELAASNRAVLDDMPKRVAAANIRARHEASKPARRPRLLMLALPTLGVAAAALVLVVRTPETDPKLPHVDGPENITIKGDHVVTHLVVYQQGHVEPLRRGSVAARGDLLQLAYVADRPGYGVLVSLDGAGHVTQHLPGGSGQQAMPLTASREMRLPSSYELDDAPRFERFFLITAPRPFAVAPIVEATRALAGKPGAADAPLPLSSDFFQTSFRVEKTRKEQP